MRTLGEVLTPSCKWTDWLALDISADMAYSREMKQMQTSKQILSVKLTFCHKYARTNKMQ